MSDITLQRDVGSLGVFKRLSAAASATAAGTGDATTTTGDTIDRFGFSAGGVAGDLAAGIIFDATQATSKTLTITWAVQDSADNSNWSDYQTGSSVVATGATAASVAAGGLEIGVNLSSARRYVRLNHAPDLSATQTDTCVTRAAGFFAGFDRLPQ